MTHEENDNTNLMVGSRLWLTAGLNAAITCAEFFGGALTGSVALFADAVHNFSDVFALALAAVARWVGSQPNSLRHSYGLKRVEVLSAFINSTILLLVTGFIIKESVVRLFHPSSIKVALTLVIAGIALLANSGSVLLLRHHDAHDLNVRSAFLHLLQDAFSSLVVVLSAAFARTRFGPYLDPIAAMVVGGTVIFSAASIIRETLGTLLEGTPKGIDIEHLVGEVEWQFRSVRMHHVHAWEIGPGQRALTAHLKVSAVDLEETESLCMQIRSFLSTQWGIQHVTLQPELKDCGHAGVLGTWKGHEQSRESLSG